MCGGCINDAACVEFGVRADIGVGFRCVGSTKGGRVVVLHKMGGICRPKLGRTAAFSFPLTLDWVALTLFLLSDMILSMYVCLQCTRFVGTTTVPVY